MLQQYLFHFLVNCNELKIFVSYPVLLENIMHYLLPTQAMYIQLEMVDKVNWDMETCLQVCQSKEAKHKQRHGT